MVPLLFRKPPLDKFLLPLPPGIMNKQHCVSLKCKVWWLETHIYWEIFTIIRLFSTPWTSHNYHFVAAVVKSFKIYSQSSFQAYSSVLLTIGSVLYIRSSELTPLITGHFTLWPTCLHSPAHLSAAGSHHSALCFCESDMFRLHIQVRLYNLCLSLSDISHLE